MSADPYCRIHNCNHCRQCMFDKHAERIIKEQAEQTDRIVEALSKPAPCKPQRRKADWPLVVAQIISVTVLIAAVVIVKT